MPDSNARTHWRRTRTLMLGLLGLWFLFAIAPQILVVPLNEIILPVLDIPLGFFLATQGALIAFVIMSFSFARRQDRIDRDHYIDGDA